jgi:hypothetical protein
LLLHSAMSVFTISFAPLDLQGCEWFHREIQASFSLSGLTCPALDVINRSAKFNQVGCSFSESLAVQELDLQWIQNLACAMSASKVGLGQNLGVLGPASVSPVMTDTASQHAPF